MFGVRRAVAVRVPRRRVRLQHHRGLPHPEGAEVAGLQRPLQVPVPRAPRLARGLKNGRQNVRNRIYSTHSGGGVLNGPDLWFELRVALESGVCSYISREGSRI